VPTIDIDSDAAHEAAQRELAKPIYPKESLTDQVIGWIEDQLYRLAAQSAQVPGGWLTVTVLAIVLLAVLITVVHLARRTLRSGRDETPALFDSHDLTAAQHRRAAEEAAAAGDWAAAIRHRVRAVARQLEETGVLQVMPGRTATELARDAAAELPHLSDELRVAATAFNDVTYGELPGSEDTYYLVVDLDTHLIARVRPAADVTDAMLPSDGWAEVR
jgi:hypothetical protein